MIASAIFGSAMLPGDTLRAQGSRLPAVQPVVIDPPASTDPYARYSTPDQCLSAGTRTELMFWRDQRPDTAYMSPFGNPRQRTAVAAVRRCLERFDLAQVPERELVGLGNAYLAAEHPDKADTVFRRYLSLVSGRPVRERAWALYQVIAGYSAARPQAVSRADHYIVQLEALGPAAAAERLIARNVLATNAITMDSLPRLEAQVTAAFAARDQLTGDDRKEWAVSSADAYTSKAYLSAHRGNGPGAIATLREGADQLGPLRSITVPMLSLEARRYLMYGKPSTAIQATYWFAPDTTGVRPAIRRPVAGKPMLLAFVDNHCSGFCYAMYAGLRRLSAKYGHQELDIVLAGRTSGFYQNFLVAQPDSEAAMIRGYWFDDIKLRGQLAVWATEFGRKTDGRLEVRSAPNESGFKARTGMVCWSMHTG